MKGILNLIVAGFFVMSTSMSMAAPAAKTELDSRWICTTNASTSAVNTSKAADNKMAKTQTSVVRAFTFAKANCRDCTKITCEAQSK